MELLFLGAASAVLHTLLCPTIAVSFLVTFFCPCNSLYVVEYVSI